MDSPVWTIHIYNNRPERRNKFYTIQEIRYII